METWARPMLSLQQVYLNHAYEDREGLSIFNGDIWGSRSVYVRGQSKGFARHQWRACRQEESSGQPRRQGFLFSSHRRIKREDLDFFDSENEGDCRIEDKDKGLYVDLW